MILEVLKARGAGASAIARDDSALTEPQQIQAAGSDTWPSPPEPAQVVILMSLRNSGMFIWFDVFLRIVFIVNFEILYLTETFVIHTGCAERIMAVNEVTTRRKCSWSPSTTCYQWTPGAKSLPRGIHCLPLLHRDNFPLRGNHYPVVLICPKHQRFHPVAGL